MSPGISIKITSGIYPEISSVIIPDLPSEINPGIPSGFLLVIYSEDIPRTASGLLPGFPSNTSTRGLSMISPGVLRSF